MSTHSDSIVSSTAASMDSVPVGLETKEPGLPDQAELGSSSLPWYEEKSSNLRLSDISLIKERGKMLNKFEVVLPSPEERAHRPPPGFHSFYINQLETGLRFPIPRSRGWVRENSLSHKGDHTFIRGNPSFHKGWMSRFFYVKRVVKKRNPWRCDMSWRDNIYTLTPSTPDRSPNPITFLAAMREKCYSAPELVKEDLPCHFGFSRKGVRLVGDLGPLIYREGGQAPKEKGTSTSEVKTTPSIGMHRAPTRPAPTREERPASISPPMRTRGIPEVPSSEAGPRTKAGPARAPALNIVEDSLVVSPSGSMATGLLCNLIPDRDVVRVWNAPDSEAIGLFAAQFTAVNATRQSFDEVLQHHTELEMQLADLEAIKAQEERAAEAQREAWRPSCRHDQSPVITFVLPAPATTAEALLTEPPPDPDGSNVTDLASNRDLTREIWSLQVDAPAILRRRDHLLVFVFVLHSPATTDGALPAGSIPGPSRSNETNHSPNRARMKENERWEGDARDTHKHTLHGVRHQAIEGLGSGVAYLGEHSPRLRSILSEILSAILGDFIVQLRKDVSGWILGDWDSSSGSLPEQGVSPRVNLPGNRESSGFRACCSILGSRCGIWGHHI
ncbi:hypothetical protein F511_23655 [Dorcoceras hygrometricum]|uniref:Uncharacterized protein n=1 Tax=Dorcoceras hygrometricum TaxID=472368 RepID=A0A2Z7C9F8_9LAMI|nr:hypothetical protein F511_23655 [Dorcoceras hygrometricum]